MSIKNNILNNFLSTATISALALGGLASVALAPIVVEAEAPDVISLFVESDTVDGKEFAACVFEVKTGTATTKLENHNFKDPTFTTEKINALFTEDSNSNRRDLTGLEVKAVGNRDGEYTFDGNPSFVDLVGLDITISGSITIPTTTPPSTDKPNNGTFQITGFNDTTNTITTNNANSITETNSPATAVITGGGLSTNGLVGNTIFVEEDSGMLLKDSAGNTIEEMESGDDFVLEYTEDIVIALVDANKGDGNVSDAFCDYDRDSNQSSIASNFIASDAITGNDPSSPIIILSEDDFEDSEGKLAIVIDENGFSATTANGIDDPSDKVIVPVLGTTPPLYEVNPDDSIVPINQALKDTIEVDQGDDVEVNEDVLDYVADGDVTYEVAIAPEYGDLYLGNSCETGTKLSKGDKFSEDSVKDDKVLYCHNGSDEKSSDSFELITKSEKGYQGEDAEIDVDIDLDSLGFDVVKSDIKAKREKDGLVKLTLSHINVSGTDAALDDVELKVTAYSDASVIALCKDDDGDDDIECESSDDEYTAGNGKFTLEEVEDGEVVLITKAEVDDNKINESITVDIAVDGADDDAEGVLLNVTFADNEKPVVVNSSAKVDLNGTLAISSDNLLVTDADDEASSLTYKLVTSPLYGNLYKDDLPLTENSTFTQKDINDGIVSYKNTKNSANDAASFEVTDAGSEDVNFNFIIGIEGGSGGMENACDFSDVPSNQTFYNEICGLKEKGVVGGYSDGSFNPTGNVLRKEMSKFLVKGLNITEDTSCTNFPDANQAEVGDLEPYIHTLKCLGISNGNNGSFLSHDPINRGEALKLLVKSLEHKGVTTLEMTITDGFVDVPTDHTFYNEIYKAYSAGLMNGQLDSNGNLQARPGDSISRGEMAKIIMNAHKKLIEDEKL